MKQLFVILLLVLCIIWLYNGIDTKRPKNAPTPKDEIEVFVNDTLCSVRIDSV